MKYLLFFVSVLFVSPLLASGQDDIQNCTKKIKLNDGVHKVHTPDQTESNTPESVNTDSDASNLLVAPLWASKQSDAETSKQDFIGNWTEKFVLTNPNIDPTKGIRNIYVIHRPDGVELVIPGCLNLGRDVSSLWYILGGMKYNGFYFPKTFELSTNVSRDEFVKNLLKSGLYSGLSSPNVLPSGPAVIKKHWNFVHQPN